METRRLGRTEHQSSVVTLGAAALAKVDGQAADAAVRFMLGRGVNHIDVAPSYGAGVAEQHLAPSLLDHRSSVFLACKTLQRTRDGAMSEMRASLARLGTDHFDLYQLHAVNDLNELEAALSPGGGIEALVRGKGEGLTRHLGITSHGHGAPTVLLEALRRFPFDTVLLPVNFVLWANDRYRDDLQALLTFAERADVGVIGIKALARRPWGDRPRTSTTWYEPFTEPGDIRACVRFTLSQAVTTMATSSDTRLWPQILDAAEPFTRMSAQEQADLVATASRFETIF